MSAADAPDPFREIQAATRRHQREHGCGAYTFEDGAGLTALAARFAPARILELGTALGYTACCLASGSPNAHVDTLERDPTHVEVARRHIAGANLSDRIEVHEGEFATGLASLGPSYGLVFFDGFAPDLSVVKTLQALLASGGVLVCANLGLASGAEMRRLTSAFGDAQLWRSLPALEGGGTAVWLKL